MTSEQKKALKRVSKPNRKIILKMQRNLSTYDLNEMEYEQTISDIIGMALEYEERGESFGEAIGDCAMFCRELVTNLPFQSKGERILDCSRWVFGFVGLFVPVVWILSFFISYMPTSSRSVYLYATTVFLVKYFIVTCVVVYGLFFVRRSVYHSQPLVWTLYFISLLFTYFAVDFLPIEHIPEVTVRINIILWCIAFSAVIAALTVAKRMIARKYANRKKHTERN